MRTGYPVGANVQEPLEVSVPRREAQCAIEHRYAVAHVVERDAQFRLASIEFRHEPRILDRDRRLVGEGRTQCNLLLGKWPDLRAHEDDHTYRNTGMQERNAENRSKSAGFLGACKCVFRIDLDIWDMNGLALEQSSTDHRSPPHADRVRFHEVNKLA